MRRRLKPWGPTGGTTTREPVARRLRQKCAAQPAGCPTGAARSPSTSFGERVPNSTPILALLQRRPEAARPWRRRLPMGLKGLVPPAAATRVRHPILLLTLQLCGTDSPPWQVALPIPTLTPPKVLALPRPISARILASWPGHGDFAAYHERFATLELLSAAAVLHGQRLTNFSIAGSGNRGIFYGPVVGLSPAQGN